jgi:hypothetical protein
VRYRAAAVFDELRPNGDRGETREPSVGK